MENNKELRDRVLYMVPQPPNWRDIVTYMRNEAGNRKIEWEIYRFENPAVWLIFTDSILDHFSELWNSLPSRPITVEHRLNYAEVIPAFSSGKLEKYEIQPTEGMINIKNIVRKKRGVY